MKKLIIMMAIVLNAGIGLAVARTDAVKNTNSNCKPDPDQNGAKKLFEITGNIIGRSSKNLLLIKATSEAIERTHIIPIKNNRFSFVLEADQPEAYVLIFEEEVETGYNRIIFFPDTAEISFELHDRANINKDKIKGGQINREYAKYTGTIADFDKKIIQLNSRINNIGEVKTLQKDSLVIIREQFRSEKSTYKNSYILNNKNIISYFLLWDMLYFAMGRQDILSFVRENRPQFSKAFPGHPYNFKIYNELDGYLKIKPGTDLINVHMEDLSGMKFTLSSLIKSQYTLIDFWASWCSSCIGKSKSMVPVYNKYHNKGLNVVGIAREFKDTENLKLALDREKFPWQNFVELDDKNDIWNKYAISNKGGMMIVVDQRGKIIQVNPTAEDLEKLMNK